MRSRVCWKTRSPRRSARNPGCALLKLVATRQAGPAPLAEVRDGLIRLLRQQKERQGEQDYANVLLARAPVRIDEIALAQLAGAQATTMRHARP